MKSADALLQMLATHVFNVTSLIDDPHVFFMVRYKEDVTARRFWFARGSLRKDFILNGLSKTSNDNEIVSSSTKVDCDSEAKS